MSGNVAIGITFKAFTIPFEAREPQLTASAVSGEAMSVNALADGGHFFLRPLPSASRRAMVSKAASSGA